MLGLSLAQDQHTFWMLDVGCWMLCDGDGYETWGEIKVKPYWVKYVVRGCSSQCFMCGFNDSLFNLLLNQRPGL